jgi:hypothetical protein
MNSCTILAENPEEKAPCGIYRRKWEINIKQNRVLGNGRDSPVLGQDPMD